MRGAKRVVRGIAAGIALVAIACGAASGQAADAGLTEKAAAPAVFAAADVHVSPHSNDPWMRGGGLFGERYILRDATMVDLVAKAYGVNGEEVLGGPIWVERDRFDILAKAPVATPKETTQQMLRALLAERFKLVTHGDTRPMPAFVLTVGKGGAAKLKQADGSGDAAAGEAGCRFQQPPANAKPGSIRDSTVTCHGVTMAQFAEQLQEFAGPYLPHPVADATGLKGAWDFEFHWTWQPPRTGSDGVTIFDAMDKQLGLKLETGKAPLPVVVVDSVNQKPTANAPGLEKALPPPPPAEFEVAIINPSDPNAKNTQISLGGNEVTIKGATMQLMIDFGWDIDDAMTVGAPKWAKQDRWDITGKISSDASAKSMQIDFDDFKIMLRSLLADRFKLKTHMEDQPVDAYTLVAAGPKLKKADPANRTTCKEGPGPDGKDPRIAGPMLGRLFTCLDISMPEFAEQLQSMASGYIKAPVLDATGIEGNYDVTLSFSSTNQMRNAVKGGGDSSAGTGDAPTAADPGGGISLFDAIYKQLGLKLEKQKRPVPVLVIDHVEEKPTDN